MARRRKEDSSERRTAGLRLQLTPAERAELDARAATTGRNLSDYARIVLLSDLKKPAPSVRNVRALGQLVVALNRIGNNVNQLAHVANAINEIPSERALRELTAQIKAAVAKVMEL